MKKIKPDALVALQNSGWTPDRIDADAMLEDVFQELSGALKPLVAELNGLSLTPVNTKGIECSPEPFLFNIRDNKYEWDLPMIFGQIAKASTAIIGETSNGYILATSNDKFFSYMAPDHAWRLGGDITDVVNIYMCGLVPEKFLIDDDLLDRFGR